MTHRQAYPKSKVRKARTGTRALSGATLGELEKLHEMERVRNALSTMGANIDAQLETLDRWIMEEKAPDDFTRRIGTFAQEQVNMILEWLALYLKANEEAMDFCEWMDLQDKRAEAGLKDRPQADQDPFNDDDPLLDNEPF